MRPRLSRISLRGFKTFADLTDDHAFYPLSLNVLIGPNGAGKSNFISFFRMLNWALTPPGGLQEYVARQGGASNLLCDGPTNTREIEAELAITWDSNENGYAFRLAYAADDTLIFTEEKFRFARGGSTANQAWRTLGVGMREAQLNRSAEEGNKTGRVIHNLLRGIVVYQFHNTSDTARIRGKWNKDDNRYLKEDGANLAAMLFRLKAHEPQAYRRIVETVRLILPFFEDFELEPQYDYIMLRWRERFSDRVFTASQAGDGMLRVMALVTLLLQPEDDLPDVLILDEPELGLHPYAIEIVGGLIRSVSEHIQVTVATQSLPLLDCFDPEDVVVVDRGGNRPNELQGGRYSRLRRLDAAGLKEWLEEYSLSELWEKNVLGGRP